MQLFKPGTRYCWVCAVTFLVHVYTCRMRERVSSGWTRPVHCISNITKHGHASHAEPVKGPLLFTVSPAATEDRRVQPLLRHMLGLFLKPFVSSNVHVCFSEFKTMQQERGMKRRKAQTFHLSWLKPFTTLQGKNGSVNQSTTAHFTSITVQKTICFPASSDWSLPNHNTLQLRRTL